MNWWDILKNAKLSGKAKSKGTTLDSSRIKIERPKTDCNMKLQEWANKLKNYDLLMKKRFEESELLQKHFEIDIDETKPTIKSFFLTQKGAHSYWHLYEKTFFYYNPVPEEVACKAIALLEKRGDMNGSASNSLEIDGILYSWMIELKTDYQDNRAELIILREGVIDVALGWKNGEDVSFGTDEYTRDLKGNREDNNVFHLSGYYEGAKFGRSWWK